MLKKSILLISALFLLASCSGDQANNEAAADKAATLTIAEFNADGEAYEGKLVEVVGTVDHVCAHSGKRLFLMGDDPSDRVKIEAGDIGSFDMAMQGSKVKIQAVGTVLKMDSAYLDNWASEVSGQEGGGEAGCSEEQKDMGVDAGEGNEALNQIIALRVKLAESGRDYLAFSSLEAKSIEEVK